MKKIIFSLIAIMACMSINAQVVKVYKNDSETPAKTFTNTETNKYKVVFEEIADTDYNGYEFVNLGLPSGLLWATCNIGATNPEDCGLYFAWGETTGYTSGASHTFYWGNYTWCSGSDTTISKYCTNSSFGTVDNKTVLESSDDAATANIGGACRMPTGEEWTELINNCTWTWTTVNDINGYIVTGTNGKSIFLPVTGYINYSQTLNKNILGCYRSSSLDTDYNSYGRYLCFSNSSRSILTRWRYEGVPVRPVAPASILNETPTCSFSKSSYTLGINDTYSQALTTNSDGKVTYSSSDNAVAVVDANSGLVKALSKGTATITATIAATDEYTEATATYTVTVVTNASAGHEFVDFGLPSGLLWATCNVGADKPEDYGDYFAWGETTGYNNADSHKFDWNNYNYSNNDGTSFTKYNATDGLTVLESGDDAAAVNWGGKWRMPTLEEINELLMGNLSWKTVNEVNGVEVTWGGGDESIFLPAAGDYVGSSFKSGQCEYWTSSLSSTTNAEANEMQLWSYTSSGIDYVGQKITTSSRCLGLAVRPVMEPTKQTPICSFQNDNVDLLEGDTYVQKVITNSDGYLDYYESSDITVATVDTDGKVTAKGPGTATITARIQKSTLYDAAEASYNITVRKNSSSSFSTSLKVGDTCQLNLSTKSSGAVTYSSSDTSMATVTQSGLVTAEGEGTPTITASVAASGEYSASSATYSFNISKVTPTCSFATSSNQLTIDDTYTQKVTTNSNGTVKYESSNTSVATVDATTGKVTAVSEGTATITATVSATIQYESATASYTVTVVKNTPTCTFSKTSKTLVKGETYTQTVETNSNGTVTYSSGNTSVATVDASTGTVTAVGYGTATITATIPVTDKYYSATASYTVTVAGERTAPTFNFSTSSATIKPGKTYTQEVTTNTDATVKYTSSDTSVATVGLYSGVVTGVSQGTVTITASASATDEYAGASATYTVTVAGQSTGFCTFPYHQVEDGYKLESGETFKLIPTVTGDGAITYSSSNTYVATVDANTGVVTTIKAGTVEITAKVAGTANYTASQDSYKISVVFTSTDTYVNLDLPSGLQWARRNLGASTTSRSDCGKYYAWGEKKGYTKDDNHFFWMTNYTYATTDAWGASYIMTKYNGTDKLTTLESLDDPARNLGSNWRMPTQTDWNELLTYTWKVKCALNGVDGYILLRNNGNNIFIPCAGYMSRYDTTSEGTGHYWSSSLRSGDTDYQNANCAVFGTNNASAETYNSNTRDCGLSIRAVYDK